MLSEVQRKAPSSVYCGCATNLGVADDVGHALRGGEGPLALVGVGEGRILVLATDGSDDVATAIPESAAESRVDVGADVNVDGVEALVVALGLGLGADVDGAEESVDLVLLVAERDLDLEIGGVALDESRVADDARDLLGLAEGPLAGVAVGEGDVDVGAAGRDQGLAILAEGLAAEVGVRIRTDADLNRLEGARGADGPALLARVDVVEGGLRAGLGALALEDDADLRIGAAGQGDSLDCGVVGCGGLRVGERAGGGEEEGGDVECGMHFN